jgi:RNA polymerase sigma factor (sigma-70 family)
VTTGASALRKEGSVVTLMRSRTANLSGGPRQADVDEVIADLYKSERSALIRLAVMMTQDRILAEDLVQDAFANLFRRWALLEDHTKAPAYLRVAVVNGSRSFHRRRALAWRHADGWQNGTSEGADTAVLLDEEYRQVVAAVHELPARQRQVIALRYWADMSDGEIAEALGVAEVTVRATMSRALSRLLREVGTP